MFPAAQATSRLPSVAERRPAVGCIAHYVRHVSVGYDFDWAPTPAVATGGQTVVELVLDAGGRGDSRLLEAELHVCRGACPYAHQLLARGGSSR